MRAALRSAAMQLKNTLARQVIQFIILIQPIVFATLSYFILRHRPGVDMASYIVIGSGLISLWSAALFSSAGDLDRERRMGNFEYLLVTPTPFETIILGKIVGNTLLGFGSMAMSYLYATLVLRADFAVRAPMLFVLGFVGTLVSFLGISLVLASAFTLSRSARLIVNGMEYPIYLVSGVMFPLTLLPQWAQVIGHLVPLTWARATLQAAAAGLPASFWPAFWGLLGTGALYYLVGRVMFDGVLRRLRVRGDAGVY
jgi:ABC-2 type transport system permease protein